ncbi:glycosyltransferase [Arthrobacter ruber]|uniref:glycosyltransferase n=1 Tax=Arthrobacter ruber TaxID=1258893 RepID=UPI000CF4C5F5|nr:glycosyltransferase [Arthrobacter ruber]
MSRKVAILGTRGYPSFYGGFETAVRFIAPHLADQGWDVTVYGRPHSITHNYPYRDARVRSKLTFGLEKKSASTLSYGLTSIVHTAFKKPEIALIMNVANGFWLPILKIRKVPTVVNVDGIEWKRDKWGKVAKWIFLQGARMTAKYADTLISDSVEIQRIWREDFGRESHYVPYGGTPGQGRAVPAELRSRGYILVVARFVPENSILEFLDAASELGQRWPVVIVGSSGYSGPIEDRVKHLAATLPLVTWLGHLNDDEKLNSLWEHAGAYFHGHSVGGTNPALVQAMACGAPVVARDTPYNREVLGPAGVLVEPNVAEIVRAIDDLMTDQARQAELSRTATAEAVRRFDWNSIVRSYETLLENGMRKSSTSGGALA